MTEHDRNILLRAADGIAKSEDMFGLAEIIRRIVKRQRVNDSDPPAGTVRVRAAVVVTSDSQWEVRGFHDSKENEITDYIGETLDLAESQVIHWIEADVPVPVPQTIQAEIQP